MLNALVIVAAGLAVVMLAISLAPHVDRLQTALIGLVLAFALTAGSIPAFSAAASVGRAVFGVMLLAAVLSTPRHGIARPTARKVLAVLWVCVGVCAASTVWSISPVETASYTAAFALLVGVTQGLVNRRWADETVIVSDLRVIFVVLTAIITVGLLAALAGMDFAIGYQDRARGLFQNANKLGNVAALTAALGWALAFRSRCKWYLVATLPVLAGIAMSESRTAMVAALIAAGWFLFQTKFMTRFLLGWAAATGAATWALLRSFGVIPPVDFLESPLARFFEGDDVPLSGRLDAWQTAIDITSYSWAGVGFGAAPDYLTAEGSLAAQMGLNSVHNSYLQWYMETGLVGLLPLAALIGLALWMLVSSPRTRLASGLGAVVIVGLAMQITESMIFGMGQLHPWVYWPAVVALAVSKDLHRPQAEGPTDTVGLRYRQRAVTSS